MKIEYELQCDEHLEYWRLHQAKYRNRFDLLPMIILVALVFLLDSILFDGEYFSAQHMPSIFIIWAAFVIGLLITKKKGFERYRKRYIPTRYSVEIAQSHLAIARVGITSPAKILWDKFTDLQETKSLYLLSTSELDSYIIPKRAFKDDKERDEFWSKCLEYYENGKGL